MNHVTRYIHRLRRQSKHVQHVHAFIFAGSITGLLAAFILYYDYGFWHQHYTSKEVIGESVVQQPEGAPPGEVLSGFWSEAKKQFSGMGSSTASLLEGKETYQTSSNSPEKQ
jgi:hypothetical protein